MADIRFSIEGKVNFEQKRKGYVGYGKSPENELRYPSYA
jgi:hypothetical protein